MNRRTLLLNYYSAMLDALGPSHWWPGQSPFEIALGAILTQNTNWPNVEKAIGNLRARGLLDACALHALPEPELAELIRPSGSFRVKAKRVRNFLNFLKEECDWDMTRLKGRALDDLRRDLLAISGIGPETADSILLYALAQPAFVVDAYTKRILNRHMLVPEDISYAELRDFFTDTLPTDTRLFNEFHALFVRIGKSWCAKKAGKCASCPLGGFLS